MYATIHGQVMIIRWGLQTNKCIYIYIYSIGTVSALLIEWDYYHLTAKKYERNILKWNAKYFLPVYINRYCFWEVETCQWDCLSNISLSRRVLSCVEGKRRQLHPSLFLSLSTLKKTFSINRFSLFIQTTKEYGFAFLYQQESVTT